jgi:uncharacterized membrane protein
MCQKRVLLPGEAKSLRIDSIDFIRGLVMIIMALDHTRDFMHITSLTQNPLDLATTTPQLFLTRWITNFCAPVFVFLSGTSAYLSLKKQNNYIQSRNFLLKRGIWLIFLEFTIINFALWFDIQFRILLFQVIAAIGFGFVFLAFLLKLRPGVIAATGLLIVFSHNLLLSLVSKDLILADIFSPVLNLTSYQISQRFTFVIAYPFLPWFGIMLTGFAFGKWFELPVIKRKPIFLKTGLAAILIFLLLRSMHSYDEPYSWTVQRNALFTILSFLNTSKYPPSFQFTLMTLGTMLILFYLVEGKKDRFLNFVSVYGRVPFFYYLIHLYLVHIVMLIIMFIQGFHFNDLSFAPLRFGRPDAESGIGLGMIYLVWILIVLILYPACREYGRYKLVNKTKRWWLRYL